MKLRVFEIDDPKQLHDHEWFRDLKQSAVSTGDVADTVSDIIDNVRQRGDDALVDYMQQWTDPNFSKSRIRVTQDELNTALETLDANMRGVLEQSIANVRAYQEHICPKDPAPITIDGATMGLRLTPVASVGLAVPGGKAAYPSSVIMLAVPAQAAGVETSGISVVTPPPTRKGDEPVGDVASLVLATCALLGIEKVYRIGGAQAMAALALGTESVEPVDMIVGPGNAYTQLAKQQLMGYVGIDGFYGPSEIISIADESANPDRVASDLIAQAEHDPGRCILVAWSREVIEGINEAIQRQLEQRDRREAIEASLDKWSAALLVDNDDTAAAVADLVAAEHLNLAVSDPTALLAKIKNGGAFFLGDQSPVASGDYYAGPSHSLPTGTTARFNSGISAYTFLKRSGIVHYQAGMSDRTMNAITQFAKAEGLDGHAASVESRR